MSKHTIEPMLWLYLGMWLQLFFTVLFKTNHDWKEVIFIPFVYASITVAYWFCFVKEWNIKKTKRSARR